MAARTVSAAVLVVAVAVAVLVRGASAQSSCTQVLIAISPCINYIAGNTTVPSSSCCSQLAALVGRQPECICLLMNGGFAEFGINKTRALGLADACNVKTPSVCNSAAILTTSPSSGTPLGHTETSPGTGSKSTPTTDVIGNGGPSLQGSAGLIVPTVHAVSTLSSD